MCPTVHVVVVHSMYVPRSLQINSISKLLCTIRNCQIANQFQNGNPIPKLRSAIWKHECSRKLHTWLVIFMLGFVFIVSRSTSKFLGLGRLQYRTFTNFTIPELFLNPRNLNVQSLILDINPTLHMFTQYRQRRHHIYQ